MAMTFAEQATVVGVSVVVSLLIGAGVYEVVKPATPVVPDVRPLRAPGDDAPIIMAGGSLYIGHHPDFSFTPDSTNHHQLNYSQAMQVSKIDVTSFDASGNLQDSATSVSSGQAGSVTLKYCRNASCNANQTDLITLAWTAANIITLTNTLGTAEPFSLMLPNLRVHLHKNWIPVGVTGTVGSAAITPVDCTLDAECNVVVHTCNPTATCNISN